MRTSVVSLPLLLVACGATVVEPSKPNVRWSDWQLLEPMTGQPPMAYATFAKLEGETSWSGTCKKDYGLGGAGAMGPVAEESCDEVAHKTLVTCDGPCAVEAGNPFSVTLTAPGTVSVRVTLKPAGLHSRKTFMRGAVRVERPTRIAPRCHGAPVDGATHVLVELYAGQTLLSGGDFALSVVGGAACTAAPLTNKDGQPTHPFRRFKCAAEGPFEVQAKGRDFEATSPVSCDPTS